MTSVNTETQQPAAATTASFRLPGLDGLRALAVTVVILFHLTPGALVGGYIGVDIFFVISGFLITGLLLREKSETGGIRLGAFWKRRARRLLPALATLVLVCSSAAFLIGGDVLVGLGRQVLGALTFSYNWVALSGGASYFDETTPELFRNLWSLAVEEQFYLVWPLLVLLLLLVPKRGLRLLLVLIAAVASASAMALLSFSENATRVYYGTDTHSFGLAIGAALAIATTGWSVRALEWSRAAKFWLPVLGSIGVAGLIALAILLPADDPLAYRGGLVAVALLTALAIVGAVVPGGFLARLLDARPIRWVGERSYGLYLWHWPVFVLVVAGLPALQLNPMGEWMLGAIALVITIVAATLSYRFIETPIRRGGYRATLRGYGRSWNPRKPLALLTAALTLATLGLGYLGYSAVTADPATGQAQAQIEAGEKALSDETAAPSGEPVALPGGDQIIAVGDSVMLAAAPELTKAFPGIEIDAVVSRQMAQGPDIVEKIVADGRMRPTLILGLGTNGPIDVKSVERVKAAIGPDVQLVLVNVQAPKGWTPINNKIFAKFAQEQRTVELANWYDAIKPHLDVLSSDQVHPGGPKGGRIYSDAIRDALQRLAELPPLLGSNDYGLSPRPS